MYKNKELDVLFHAWGLQSSYFSTRYCRIFKSFTEQAISREELQAKLPIPEDQFWEASREELKRSEDLGIDCITILDPAYPAALREIVDPPLVLFISGKEQWTEEMLNASYLFSIVGTRKMTPYGHSITRTAARALSGAGITVVSGLAHGVDRAAHENSLSAGFKPPTIAVLGSGLLEVYPALNRALAAEIIDRGGYLISEYGLNARPLSHHFPRRNRIVSGLSLGVLIVEAEEKSGSLITARLAMEQGREVFAVPGPIDAPCSQGCNRILSEGASPMLSVPDFINTILEKYTRLSTSVSKPKTRAKKKSSLRPEIIKLSAKPLSTASKSPDIDSPQHEKLLSILEQGPLSFDEIIEYLTTSEVNYSESELRTSLMELQMNDIIEEVTGTYRFI